MPSSPPSPSASGSDSPTRFRSGAVARMLGMPVATLRVWERRYALSQAAITASGQRLYSAADVHRLALIKQLSERGHAIGSLARLSPAQLQAVAATHAQVLAGRREAPAASPAVSAAPSAPARIVLIGQGWSQRLRAWGLRLGDGLLPFWGPFDDMGAAEAAWPLEPVDLVLIQQAQLHPGFLDSWRGQAPRLSQRPTALLYRFGADTLCQSLSQAGLRLLREPQPDAVCRQWLEDALARPVAPRPALSAMDAPGQTQDLTPPPRRWSDAALADFAGLSTTVACECPRHLAELLMQMSHFETYSAQCESLSPADAALHRHLWQLAADCRARFETALEHVALHEGLLLPSG